MREAQYPVVIKDKIHMFSDNPSKLQAITTGFKLLGLMSGNQQSYQDNRSLTINLNTNDVKDLQQVVSDLREMRQRDDKISGAIE